MVNPKLQRWLLQACFLPETPIRLTRTESKPIIEFKSEEEFGEACDRIITRDCALRSLRRMSDFEMGLKAFQEKSYQAAIAYLRTSLENDPSNTRGYVGIGKSCYFLGQNEAAIEAFSSGIEKSPDCAQLYLCRGIVFAEGLKETDLALADFQKALQLDPELSDASYNAGQAFLRKKQYLQAIEAFSHASSDDPRRNAAALAGQAAALAEVGQYSEALACSNNAISYDSTNSTAYACRGLVHGLLKDYKQGIIDCSRAIDLNPRDATSFFNRANCYECAFDYASAISDYSRAIELNVGYADAYNNRGNCLCKSGRDMEAINDFTHAIDLGNHIAYANRGNVYYAHRQYEKAILDYDNAIRHEPTNAELFILRSHAHEEAGHTAEARNDAEVALHLGGKSC